jgi:predicted HNH restriction endonuclease
VVKVRNSLSNICSLLLLKPHGQEHDKPELRSERVREDGKLFHRRSELRCSNRFQFLFSTVKRRKQLDETEGEEVRRTPSDRSARSQESNTEGAVTRTSTTARERHDNLRKGEVRGRETHRYAHREKRERERVYLLQQYQVLSDRE